MIGLLQRVSEASVRVGGEIVGEIGRGLMVLVAVERGDAPGQARPPVGAPLLLASVFVIAVCGLIYELLAGALSSYLLGSSVTQFSLVIGLFLSAMGLGSYLSRLFDRRLLEVFLVVEVLIGLAGGSSALILFSTFAVLSTYR